MSLLTDFRFAIRSLLKIKGLGIRAAASVRRFGRRDRFVQR
jgi:hypothetical protein